MFRAETLELLVRKSRPRPREQVLDRPPEVQPEESQEVSISEDLDERIDPDDAGSRLSVILQEPVGETYALPAAQTEQTSGCDPYPRKQSTAPESPRRAFAAAASPPPPDLLDPVALRTMPPKVAAFMLYEPREPPPWRRQESEGEREFREQCESDGAWCG